MIRLIRQPRWEERMNQYIIRHGQTKFDHANFDCVRFTAGVVESITGVDLISEIRGKYKNRKEAIGYLKELGSDGFYRKVDEVFSEAGFDRVSWKEAMRGDPCFFPNRIGVDGFVPDGLGVCGGVFAITPNSEGNGLKQIPMTEAKMVWHISFTF